MEYYCKWPEAYAIPNQEASTVAEALDLHNDQGHNFQSCLLHEVLQHLAASKTCTTRQHP
jgi:hypothetical protein